MLEGKVFEMIEATMLDPHGFAAASTAAGVWTNGASRSNWRALREN
jgi:hypothetical protein